MRLVPGPETFVVRDGLAVAEDPHPVEVGDDLDPASDHRRMDRVVVGVQPDVVVAGQPGRGPPTRWPGPPAAGVSIAWRSAPIRSVGAQPSARRVRPLTLVEPALAAGR